MKFPILLIALACLFGMSQTGLSQTDNTSIGPRVGINFNNVSNLDGSETTTGLVLGLTSTYSINETSGVTVDILYSQEGYALAGVDRDLDYLRIPLYYNVFLGQLGDPLRPKFYVGFAPGFLLGSKVNDIKVDDQFKGFALDLSGGVGVNYRVAPRIWLNADARAFLGLGDIREEAFQVGDNLGARNVQLSLGLAFGLSRLE
ncbi:MAG: outer membrane beta-barrel protein [Saprospiraceae bacterium]|nr:outer membrane beta-barrel protein [Saprospiraceae bacterium]